MQAQEPRRPLNLPPMDPTFSRSHSRFVAELRRHMPDMYADIIARCAEEVYDHRGDFADRSKFWNIVHSVAEALQASKFGDSFVTAICYQQTAGEIIKSGEINPRNLEWARSLVEKAVTAAKASRDGAPYNTVDHELKDGIGLLVMEIDTLILQFEKRE